MPASPSWKADAGSVPCSATNSLRHYFHQPPETVGYVVLHVPGSEALVHVLEEFAGAPDPWPSVR